jgi:hypothetical protein
MSGERITHEEFVELTRGKPPYRVAWIMGNACLRRVDFYGCTMGALRRIIKERRYPFNWMELREKLTKLEKVKRKPAAQKREESLVDKAKRVIFNRFLHLEGETAFKELHAVIRRQPEAELEKYRIMLRHTGEMIAKRRQAYERDMELAAKHVKYAARTEAYVHALQETVARRLGVTTETS